MAWGWLGYRCSEAEMDRRLRSHENSFDALRLLFALLVLFSHSYPLLGRDDEFFAASFGYDTGGGFAVAGFFVISGLLVARSALSSDLRRYAAGRVLRIVPGLAAMSVICALIIGPLVTALSPGEYFTRRETWVFLTNAFVFPLRFYLPGVFADNPLHAVNGSIWTLPIETAMYVLLPLGVVIGLVSRLGTALLLAAVSAALCLGVVHLGLPWQSAEPSLARYVPLFVVLKFGFFFVSGTLLFVYRGVIPVSPLLAAAILVLLGVLGHTTAGLLLWFAGLPYLVFCFGFLGGPLGAFFKRHGDLSYGVYIYAFPVQQCIVHALGRSSLDVQSLILFAVPPTLALAYLSWHMIERRALGWKRYWGTGRPPAVQPVTAEPSKSSE